MTDNDWVVEKSHILLEAADNLVAAALYGDALPIYRSLENIPELGTASLFIDMAKCYKGLEVGSKAEECLQNAIQLDEDNVEARLELAKMYEDLGQKEQAFILVNEAIQKERDMQAIPAVLEKRKRGRPRVEKRGLETTQAIVTTKHRRTGAYKPRTLTNPEERAKEETARAKQLDEQFSILFEESDGMRNGDKASTDRWIDAARDVTNDFRACNAFYDGQVIVKFLGYITNTGTQTKVSIDPDLAAMADRLSKSMLFS